MGAIDIRAILRSMLPRGQLPILGTRIIQPSTNVVGDMHDCHSAKIPVPWGSFRPDEERRPGSFEHMIR